MVHINLLEIVLLILIFVFAILYYTQYQLYKTLKETKIENFSAETTQLCEDIKAEKNRELVEFKQQTELRMEELEKLLSEKEKRYNEINQDLDKYKKDRLTDIDNSVEDYYELKLSDILNTIQSIKDENVIELNKETEQQQEEIEKIKNELMELRSRRAAINEEILRQRKLEEQQDFYKIQLLDIDKPDIEILRATAPRLQHPETINKIIWSNYYQKPLAELRKRLLPDGDYSGIYKLTRLKTGEIYIGQTTSINKRFQDHVKSALGVGTLTSSQLHRTMAMDGPENFTFEIIEKVEKDKLKEREAYYINFYDSKNYGLNTVKGQEK